MTGFQNIDQAATSLLDGKPAQRDSEAGESAAVDAQQRISGCFEDDLERNPVHEAMLRFYAARNKKLLESTGIPRIHWHKGLKAYNPQADPKCDYLLRMAKKFVEDFDPADAALGLYLHGNTGCGKSTLAAGIALEIVRHKTTNVRWHGTIALFQAMRDAWAARQGTQWIQEMTRCDLLVIDDMGAEQPEEWILTQLYRVINQRLEDNHGSLIITSNYSPEELRDRFRAKGSDMGDRIISRIKAACCLPDSPFPNVDFRGRIIPYV